MRHQNYDGGFGESGPGGWEWGNGHVVHYQCDQRELVTSTMNSCWTNVWWKEFRAMLESELDFSQLRHSRYGYEMGLRIVPRHCTGKPAGF